MENLRYKKIYDFLQTLNNREKEYICRKLKREILESEVLTTNFTINGQPIKVNS